MELTLNDVNHLLDKVSDLNKKYEEIARITGENFNIFNILKLSTNEVRTHSAILGDLLNPSGSHGFNDRFLKLFIETILSGLKECEIRNKIELLNTSSAWCDIEYNAGFISTDGLEGGRIDILIRDRHNHALIIENKIYAGDQKNQLIRYNNAFKDAPILYLTLDGRKPSEQSCHELAELDDYACISYKMHIIKWLELCKKEAVDHSTVREIIKQYINLINQLTNQSNYHHMKDQILNSITANPNYVDSILYVLSNINKEEVKKAIVEVYFQQLINALEDKYEIYSKDFYDKEDGELWIIPNDESWKEHALVLTISKGYELLELGIYKKDDSASGDAIYSDLKLQVRSVLKNLNLGDDKNHNDWIWLIDYQAWLDMSWPDITAGKLGLAGDIQRIFNALNGVDL